MSNSYLLGGDGERRHRLARQLDRVIHEKLAIALETVAAEFASEDGPVYRIRKLDLSIWLDLTRNGEAELARNWANALATALWRTIADGGSSHVLRYADQSVFLATWIADVIDSNTDGQWQYAEFNDLLHLPAGRVITVSLARHPKWILSTLQALAQNGKLSAVISTMTAHDVSVLWKAWTGESPEAPVNLSMALPDALRQTFSDMTVSRWTTTDARAQTGLRWLTKLTSEPGGLPAPAASGIALVLANLSMLTAASPELRHALASSSPERVTLRSIVTQLPSALKVQIDWIEKVLELSQGAKLLSALASKLPAASQPAVYDTRVQTEIIRSQYAGSALLLPVLHMSGLGDVLGPHRRLSVLSQLYTGLDTTLARSDIGLRWLTGLAVEMHADDPDDAAVWPSLPLHWTDDNVNSDPPQIQTLHYLAMLFRGQYRALEGTSLKWLTSQFFARPGRLESSPENLCVYLENVPLEVVLKVTGKLGDLGKIPWLDDRSLTIEVADV